MVAHHKVEYGGSGGSNTDAAEVNACHTYIGLSVHESMNDATVSNQDDCFAVIHIGNNPGPVIKWLKQTSPDDLVCCIPCTLQSREAMNRTWGWGEALRAGGRPYNTVERLIGLWSLTLNLLVEIVGQERMWQKG